MHERYGEYYLKFGPLEGRDVSGWAFYDGAYFRMDLQSSAQQTDLQDDKRTKDLIEKIGKYHEKRT